MMDSHNIANSITKDIQRYLCHIHSPHKRKKIYDLVHKHLSGIEMKEHYEEMYAACVGELKFYRIMNDSLVNALEEVSSMTEDPLAKRVCDLAVERYNIDKMIHARNLFSDK